MKLVRIFVCEETGDGIWSIQLDNEPINEFDKFIDQVNDMEWLYQFFEENDSDLNGGFFGIVPINEAISNILAEVEEMEDALFDYTDKGFAGDCHHLQCLFQPLNNFEYAIIAHQKSKARIKKGMLRLYAIRLAKNCYVITGGAVKLTHNMERDHLQWELKKLQRTKAFLINNGIDYSEDLNTFFNEYLKR